MSTPTLPLPPQDAASEAHGPEHRHRLGQALRALLQGCRVAALGTLQADGTPFVSMVPYALWPAAAEGETVAQAGEQAADPVDRASCTPEAAALVLHVSALAPHTAQLQRNGAVSLLVMQPEQAGAPVHALPRVSLLGQAELLVPGSPAQARARSAYLQRFPEAEPMTALGDFSFVKVRLLQARQVAGFGAARSLDGPELSALLRA